MVNFTKICRDERFLKKESNFYNQRVTDKLGKLNHVPIEGLCILCHLSSSSFVGRPCPAITVDTEFESATILPF